MASTHTLSNKFNTQVRQTLLTQDTVYGSTNGRGAQTTNHGREESLIQKKGKQKQKETQTMSRLVKQEQ